MIAMVLSVFSAAMERLRGAATLVKWLTFGDAEWMAVGWP